MFLGKAILKQQINKQSKINSPVILLIVVRNLFLSFLQSKIEKMLDFTHDFTMTLPTAHDRLLTQNSRRNGTLISFVFTLEYSALMQCN
jgi:hypothetical protein